MLMPSHAKNVKQYKETVPLFHKHHIEAQLDAMFSPTVTLKSGGYIVINQTEALVAVDVNSGRATREHNIEDTAYKTNLEAADEVGRQLRLRDLAGLIVIDFIDMEDSRNDRNVEKRLRDAVKTDRARVQIGKISQFGLLEMSRQRLRAGVIAGSTIACPHCDGQGIVRSVESTALRVLRGLEEEGQKQRAAAVTLRLPADVAVYTLNQKRRELMRIENDYGMSVTFEPDDRVTAGNFEIERTQIRAPEERRTAVTVDSVAQVEEPDVEPEQEAEVEERPARAESENGNGGRRRRRRRRGRDRDRPAVMQEVVPTDGETEFDAEKAAEAGERGVDVVDATEQESEDGEGKRKRRRRRRGRRGRRDNGETENTAQQAGAESQNLEGVPVDASVRSDDEHTPEEITAEAGYVAIQPNAPSEPVWSLAGDEAAELPAVAPEAPQPPQDEPEPPRPAEPAAAEASPEPQDEPVAQMAAPAETAEEPNRPQEDELSEPEGPPRKGWWQRPFRARE